MSESKRATRDAYGNALLELGRENEEVVVLDADLSPSTRTYKFAEEFPERFFDIGIAEADMVSMAAGFASSEKTVFANSFSVFGTEKGLNQLKQSVAYPNIGVNLVVTHGGISVGEDGSSHFCVNDIAIMRSLPNVSVVLPADPIEAEEATRAIAEHGAPVFMRLGRPKIPCIYKEGYRYGDTDLDFEVGKCVTLKEGEDVAIVATGLMVPEALEAASDLEEGGIDARVINAHTIKPLDEEEIVRAARGTGALITAEEHNIYGGLGGAVAEVLVENEPTPMARVGIRDTYAESGPWKELFAKYNLTAADIAKAAREISERKK